MKCLSIFEVQTCAYFAKSVKKLCVFFTFIFNELNIYIDYNSFVFSDDFSSFYVENNMKRLRIKMQNYINDLEKWLKLWREAETEEVPTEFWNNFTAEL
jgi:hypothetical protein